MDENNLIDVIEVYKQIDLNKETSEQQNELEIDEDDDLLEVADLDNVAQEIRDIVICPYSALDSHVIQKSQYANPDLEDDADVVAAKITRGYVFILL
ncbi:hypothetical protein Tco_0045692 [Tanacetum coccineum]